MALVSAPNGVRLMPMGVYERKAQERCVECRYTLRHRFHTDKRNPRYHPFVLTASPDLSDVDKAVDAITFPRELVERMDRQQTWAGKLIQQGMHPMTALIVAGDLIGAEDWTKRVNAGDLPAENAAWLVGSYARLDWAIEHCERDWVVANIAELWRSSDPDDTNISKYLPIWQEAARLSENGYVRDGAALPSPVGRSNGRFLMVYRGQMPDDAMGMAWTTDEQIAHKFAKGAGVRVPTPGTVFRGFAWRQDVLGYLTGRGEAEVVIDPASVMGIEVIGQYETVKGKSK